MKRSELLPITLIVFVDVLGFTVVIPLLPFYAEHYGASPALIGAMVSVYAACSLLSAPLLGRWSDRYGRKPVLLLSQAGSLLGFVMLALAPSLAWVFAARALDGLTAGNIATARAYLADVTAPKDRTAAFGLISAAYGFGFLVGPAAAAALVRYGQQVPLWAGAGVSAASILCTLFLLSARPRTALRLRPPVAPFRLFETSGVVARLFQWSGFLLGFSMFTAGFALFCERRLSWNGVAFGPTQVGLALAYAGLLGLITQLGLLQPLVRRIGEARLVRWSLGGAILAYCGLALVHDLPLLLACLSLSAVATSALRPSLLGLISQQVPADRQGQVFGLTQSLQSLAMIIGPLFAGGLIQAGWLSGWAVACAAVMLLAMLAQRRLANGSVER